MKRTRVLISLLLVSMLLVGIMPTALAGECPKSPTGNHLWVLYQTSGTWISDCEWEGYS